MEQSRLWDVNSYLATQEIRCIFETLKGQYCVYKSQPLVCILSLQSGLFLCVKFCNT